VRDLPVRTATALVYGGVLLAAGFVAGPWLTLVLAVLFAIGSYELWRLARRLPNSGARVGALVVGLLVLGGGLFSLLYLTSYMQGHGELVQPGARPWLAMNLFPWVYMALLPTWSADVIAYFAGSAIGRHRLAPRISPGKTWEGTIAGFFAAAIVAWFVGSQIFSPALPAGLIAFLAVAIGPSALAGDLLESALKRAAGAKDSGTIFPGHGGVLDRIDSLLLVSPVVGVALSAYRSGMIGL
jgi:phosphatidate cytidylyltransferase